ncbi:MAG: hypothetical protein ACYTGL_01635 [Planctomycetota bacterium]
MLTVETRELREDAWISLSNEGFHDNGNAEALMLAADALSKGMLNLLNAHRKP